MPRYCPQLVPGTLQHKLVPPPPEHLKHKPCLVLDLDETLIHSVFNATDTIDEKYDFCVEVSSLLQPTNRNFNAYLPLFHHSVLVFGVRCRQNRSRTKFMSPSAQAATNF